MATGGGYHNGVFRTYDGSLYRYHNPGEHLLSSLKLSTTETIDVHVLQVISSDKYNSVSTQGCGFRVGVNSVQLLMTTPGNHVLWYNDEIREVGDKLKISNEADIMKIAYNNYQIVLANQLTVDIFLFEAWMNVIVKVNPTLCSSAVGLISQCNNRTNDDFKLRSGIVLTPEIGGTLSQTSIHDRFGPSWLVPADKSIFTSVGKTLNGCGRGLNVSNSHLLSTPLFSFSETQVTVEIKFKLTTDSKSCQTIWSYKNEDVFTLLVCDGHVSLHYMNERRDFTTVRISVDVWYHLAVSWLSKTRTINVYTFTQSLVVSSKFTILEVDKPNPFKPGGTLMIGQWNFPEFSRLGMAWNLHAHIDDLRIWRKVLSISEIRANAFQHIEETMNKLSNHWKFNSIIKDQIDIITGVVLYSYKTPWPHPQSVLMSYALSAPSISIYQVYNSLMLQTPEITTTCQNFMFSRQFTTACSLLGATTMEFLKKQCIFSAVVSGNVQNAMEVVLVLSDLCGNRQQSTWPARNLCHSFPDRPFPIWTGEHCNVKCISGLYTNNSCQCYDGFWGPECGNLCPHVNGRVCGEGKTCNMQSGECSCSENFAPGCNQCSAGWFGRDCSSARINTTGASHAVFSVSGKAHYVMFDGQTFSLDRAGEFQVIQTASLSIYVRQLNCGMFTFCIKEVWIQINSKSLTIQTSLENEEKMIFWLNKKKIQIETYLQIDGYTVRLENLKLLSVTFGSNKIRISRWQTFLQLTVSLEKSLCSSNLIGLAGNCDGNVNNDFVVGTGKFINQAEISKEIIRSSFSKFWEVKGDMTTGFIYRHGSLQEPMGIYGQGLSVLFNGTGSYSSLLSDLFSPTGSGMIQFNFKPMSHTGMIVAYQSASSLTVYLNNTVQIQWGTMHIDTSLQINLKQWYHFTLSYNATQRALTIYILLGHEIVWWTETTATEAVFKQTGILKIAEWKDNAPFQLSSFFGQVNEIKIWNYPHPVYKLLFSASYRLATSFPSLTAYWDFHEGSGYVAVDMISKYQLRFPPFNVFWWISDLDLTGLPTTTLDLDPLLKDNAARLCREAIKLSPLQNTCRRLGVANIFYYLACVSDVSVSNALNVLPILQQYSEFCAAVVEPTQSLLITLCLDTNYTKSLNDSLFDALCLDLCKFGYYDENRKCVCNAGYWDSDCSKICPGGVESSCHGKGLCDQNSGECLCLPTFDPATNCSSCVDGWAGANCSVLIPDIVTTTSSPPISTIVTTENPEQTTELSTSSYSETTPVSGASVSPLNGTTTGLSTTQPPPIEYPNHACMIFGQGHIYTFRKASFKFLFPGEFFVVKDNKQHPEIQIRTTYCYNSSICISAVAIRYDSDVLVVQSGYTSETNFIIWKNETRQDFDDTSTLFMSKTKLQHNSKSKITIESTSGQFFKMGIRSLQGKLSVTVRLSELFCENSEMLCGSCVGDEIRIYNETWKVPSEKSLFDCMYSENSFHETRKVSTAGHSVFLNNSEISSDFMKDVIRPNIDFTIELAVKPLGTKGVILSYRTMTGFDLFVDTTFKIMVNGSNFDTAIPAALGKWHQITIVWQYMNFQIVFYSYCENGDFQYLSFTVSQNFFFENYGYLGLGHPSYPSTLLSPHSAENQYFVGEIDELRIWHKAFLYTDVVEQRLLRIETYSNLLVCHWNFDEGYGNMIRDFVNYFTFRIINYGILRRSIEWKISGLPLQPPNVQNFNTFYNVEEQIKAEKKCKQLVNNYVFDECNTALGRGYLSLFYVTCVDDIAGSLNIEVSMTILVDMSDYCQETAELTIWPAQQFCQEFAEFPDWVGPHCSLPCLYPNTFSSEKSCDCQPGFWGLSCNNVCPGGLGNACNGHGICNTTTGNCHCSPNWQGINCDQCAEDWYGDDCSVAVQIGGYDGDRVCTLTGNGLLSMLDGASLMLNEYGTFEVFKSLNNVKIQVVMQTCTELKSCIMIVGMQFQNSNTLTISAVNGGKLKLDGKVLDAFYQIRISENYILTRVDKYTFKIIGPKGLLVQVFIQEGFINIFVTASPELCSSSSGLCGFCKEQSISCTPTDLDCLIKQRGIAEVLLETKVSTHIILKFVQGFLVNEVNNIIFDQTNKKETGFGIAISNGYLASSVFTAKNFSTDFVTLQIRTKIHTWNGDGCVILSYGNKNTFAVVILDGHFHIQFGSNLYKTSLSVQISIWIQISILYQQTTGELIFHYVSNETSISTYLIIPKDVFTVGGSLVIGQWQESDSGLGSPPNGTFVGDIDSILVWSRRLTYSDIILYWQSPLVNPTEGLIMGWNFDNGRGLISHDFVSNQALIMSVRGTMWIESDFYQEQKEIASVHINYPKQDSTPIIDFCSNVMTAQNFLGNMCSGTSLRSYIKFYQTFCIVNIASSKSHNFDIAMDVIFSFSEICQVYKGLVDFPAQLFCNNFQTRNFPIWKGSDCSIHCIFGKIKNNTCICDAGFWGPTCKNQCPGGYRSACNEHGVCDTTTGTCRCEVQWSGDGECSTCASGYTGKTCTMMEPEISPEETTFHGCYINSKSEFWNFANIGHGRSERKPGIYKFISMGEIQIEVRDNLI